jgi:hypothetical protein
MSEYSGARVTARKLTAGYAAALDRFSASTRKQDPDPAFFALFECLNWAVAVDDLIREVWSPDGEALGWEWREFQGGEALADLLNGVRYARNLVHHHWADALELDDGFRFPVRFPMVFFSWVWRAVEQLPEHPGAENQHVTRNRDAYSRRLAGVRAEDTLFAMAPAFECVGLFLDPPRPGLPTASS